MSTTTLAPVVETPERVTPETVSPLKPSEALRLGRLTRPLRDLFFMTMDTDHACALGAIYTAVDPGHPAPSELDLKRYFPDLFVPRDGLVCPVDYAHGPASTLASMVIHLNDGHFNEVPESAIAAYLAAHGQ